MMNGFDNRRLTFVKMHGLGNDFAIFDGREAPILLNGDAVRRVADRRNGIGCDQVIVIEPSDRADVRMRVFNADGGESGACGNASRCVARLLGVGEELTLATIEAGGRVLNCQAGEEGLFAVDMGAADFDWAAIPLAEERDTMAVKIDGIDLPPAVTVNVGNPHAVVFLENAGDIDLAEVGPRVEKHPLFPDGVNLSLAELVSPTVIRLRVWERGTGVTEACGTAAVAAFAAAKRKGLVGSLAEVRLPGGNLGVEERGAGHIWMTGPAAHAFSGQIDAGTYAIVESSE